MERAPEVQEQKSRNQVAEGGHANDITIPWLKLGLDAPRSEEEKPRVDKPAVTPQRTFSCNYCMRKFFSSQALGGHQNAHKRCAARKSRSFQQLMIGFHPTASFIQPMRANPHSTILTKQGERSAVPVARFHEGPTSSWLPFAVNEVGGLVWPGSFKASSPDLKTQPEQNLDLIEPAFVDL